MEYVRLGRSGLLSSVVGLGGGSSGRFGLLKGGTKSDAIRLIRTAMDEGITLFDCAGICGGVDELLGEALAERRTDVLVSTKVHLGPDPLLLGRSRFANRVAAAAARRAGFVCSGRTIRRRVEEGLKALRTDYVDLLHLHAVTPRQYPSALVKLVPALMTLKQEGKVRAIGVTEGFLSDPDHAMLRAAVADRVFDTIMVGFNVRNPSAAKSVIPAASKAGMGVLGMFAMRGLLKWQSEELGRIVREERISLSELAYRYSRHQCGMSVVLTGTGNARHLRQNVASALAPPLPPDVLQRLNALSSPVQAEEASTRK